MNVPVARTPHLACPPLVVTNATAPPRAIRKTPLGSSFVVAGEWPAPMIVTAGHVVTDVNLTTGERFTAAFLSEPMGVLKELRYVNVDRWHVREDLDLAVGTLNAEDVVGLPLHHGDLYPNADLYSLEHRDSLTPRE